MGVVYTVGHGTRTTEELIEILLAAGVGRLIDVRRFPGSRRHPQFNKQALERSLTCAGIDYEWRGEQLGGRRRASKVSRHGALRNKSFQGYADFMDSPEFAGALEKLTADAQRDPPVAIMCAETLWWRCHRKLIADALNVEGVDVVHLLDERNRRQHQLSAPARPGEDGRVVYDVAPDG